MSDPHASGRMVLKASVVFWWKTKWCWRIFHFLDKWYRLMLIFTIWESYLRLGGQNDQIIMRMNLVVYNIKCSHETAFTEYVMYTLVDVLTFAVSLHRWVTWMHTIRGISDVSRQRSHTSGCICGRQTINGMNFLRRLRINSFLCAYYRWGNRLLTNRAARQYQCVTGNGQLTVCAVMRDSWLGRSDSMELGMNYYI
jgi:hypothetical protein